MLYNLAKQVYISVHISFKNNSNLFELERFSYNKYMEITFEVNSQLGNNPVSWAPCYAGCYVHCRCGEDA